MNERGDANAGIWIRREQEEWRVCERRIKRNREEGAMREKIERKDWNSRFSWHQLEILAYLFL